MAKKLSKNVGYQSEILKRLAKIKHSESIRDDADKRYGYTRALKMYNGEFKDVMPSWLSGVDLIPINEVYAYVKTFVPSVYSRDPYITINPKGVKYILGAKMLELGINSYWRELRLKRQVRRAIFDAIFVEGWIKTGYSNALGSMKKPEGKMSIAPSEYMRDKEIFAQRISWKNIVRDTDAVDGIHDARFVAHQIILPIEAVRASDLYENTDDLQPNYSVEIAGPGLGRGGPIYKDEIQYVVLWEEWDSDEECVYTYAEGSDKFLMKKPWPYEMSGYPFEMLRFNDATDEAYAPNLISPWEPQLWEKIKLRAMELDHLKRFGRQYLAEKGSLSKMEKDKLIKGITGSIIEKEQGKPDPTVLQYPPIQTDIYGVEGRIDLDKDNISGQPNAVRSAPQKTQSRTLGEVDRLISAFQSRQNDPQDIIEDFSEEISKKLISLMQQYFDKPKYIRATSVDQAWLDRQMQDNPDTDKFDGGGFIMNRSDIKNIDFEVEVRAGSTLPMDRKNRIQSMISVIELGQRIGIQDGDKLSRVVGKNLVADFDMPEIMAAYEEVIKKLEVAEKMQRAEAMVRHQMLGDKIQATKQQLAQMRTSNGGGVPGAQGAPIVPPGALA